MTLGRVPNPPAPQKPSCRLERFVHWWEHERRFTREEAFSFFGLGMAAAVLPLVLQHAGVLP